MKTHAPWIKSLEYQLVCFFFFLKREQMPTRMITSMPPSDGTTCLDPSLLRPSHDDKKVPRPIMIFA